MNLSTIGIIFVLFFCSAAWAGPFRPRAKIVPNSSNTPSPQINASDPGSKSFSTRIMEGGIDYYLPDTDSDYLNPEQQQQQQQTSQSIRRTNFLGDGTGTGNSNSNGGRNKTRRNSTKPVAPLHQPKTEDNPVADLSMAFGNEPPRPISMSASQRQQQHRTSSSTSPRSHAVKYCRKTNYVNASDPGSKSSSTGIMEGGIDYYLPDTDSEDANAHCDDDPGCVEIQVAPLLETDNPVADPTKFFPYEALLQAVSASQQRPQAASSSYSGGGGRGGRKNGQLESRKKIDGLSSLSEIGFFLPDSAGGNRTQKKG